MRITVLLLVLFLGIKSYGQFVADSTAKRLGIISVQEQGFMDGQKSPSWTITKFLNEFGQVKRNEYWVNYRNKMNSITYYIYDNDGKLIEEKKISYYGSDTNTYFTYYCYNEQGLLDDNGMGQIIYNFNIDSLLVKKIEKTAKPCHLKTMYEYDDQCRLISLEEYFYMGMRLRTTYKYNDNGKMIKEIDSYFDYDKENPSSQYETVYEFDAKGLLIIMSHNQTINDRSEKMETRIYKYTYTFKK